MKKQRNFFRIFFIDDQCYPYEALGCDFSKEGFKGTLFNASEISTQEITISP